FRPSDCYPQRSGALLRTIVQGAWLVKRRASANRQKPLSENEAVVFAMTWFLLARLRATQNRFVQITTPKALRIKSFARFAAWSTVCLRACAVVLQRREYSSARPQIPGCSVQRSDRGKQFSAGTP